MAAQRQEDAPSVQLVRLKAFNKVHADLKNPPKPSNALIQLFAKHK